MSELAERAAALAAEGCRAEAVAIGRVAHGVWTRFNGRARRCLRDIFTV
jgi:hypothetical protein